MAGLSNKAAELIGWKEIAGYLRVSVRTAQGFEKQQGLPIHRGSGLKAPVFAIASEVDAWRLRRETQSGGMAEAVPSPESLTPRRTWLRYGLGGAAVIAAGALGYGLKSNFGRDTVAASYRVQGSTLIVLNRDDRELWRHRFPQELLEEAYKNAGPYGPKDCLFADLAGDGNIETIFRQVRRGENVEMPLTCFDAGGKVRWEFMPGRTVVDNLGRSFAPPYWPNNFQEFRAKSSRSAHVVVVSHHNWTFPTQVAVLDGSTGKLLSEYWHRGHLLHMASADLDGDGEPEILLGGVNDAPEYKRATLVIFDHRNISGASKNPNGGVYYQGMSPGTEKRVVFFPRTAISRSLEFNRVSGVTVASGRIRIIVVESTGEYGPYVVYELDHQLRPINVALSNTLMEQYRMKQANGLLPKESLDAVAERLKSEMLIL
jgi:hypothetical protein